MVGEELLASLPPSVQEVIAAGGQTGGTQSSGGGSVSNGQTIEQVQLQSFREVQSQKARLQALGIPESQVLLGTSQEQFEARISEIQRARQPQVTTQQIITKKLPQRELSRFEQLRERPFGESQKADVSQVEAERRRLKAMVDPSVAAQVLAVQAAKPIQQSISTFEPADLSNFFPEPKPELKEEIQRGIREQQELKTIQQTVSKGVFGEKQIIKPDISQDFFGRLPKRVVAFGGEVAKGTKEIFKTAFETGQEIRDIETSGLTKEQKKAFKAQLAQRLIETAKKPEVQTVGLLGAIVAAPTAIQVLGTGVVAGTETERFLQDPSPENIGMITALVAAPAVAKAGGKIVRGIGRRYIESVNPFIQNIKAQPDIMIRPSAGREPVVLRTRQRPEGKIIDLKETTKPKDPFIFDFGDESQFVFRPETTLKQRGRPDFQVSITPVVKEVSPGIISTAIFESVLGSELGSVLGVKKQGKRRISKAELRKQTFQRQFDPRTFKDVQTGELGLKGKARGKVIGEENLLGFRTTKRPTKIKEKTRVQEVIRLGKVDDGIQITKITKPTRGLIKVGEKRIFGGKPTTLEGRIFGLEIKGRKDVLSVKPRKAERMIVREEGTTRKEAVFIPQIKEQKFKPSQPIKKPKLAPREDILQKQLYKKPLVDFFGKKGRIETPKPLTDKELKKANFLITKEKKGMFSTMLIGQGKTQLVLIQKQLKMKPFLPTEKRKPLPLPKQETTLPTSQLILEEKLKKPKARPKDSLRGIVGEPLPQQTRPGFRRGMFERLKARIGQKQRGFILVEPPVPTQAPRTNLPALLGITGLARVPKPSKVPSVRIFTPGEISGAKEFQQVGVPPDIKTGQGLDTGQFLGTGERIKIGTDTGVRTELGIDIESGMGSRIVPITDSASETDTLLGTDMDTALAQDIAQDSMLGQIQAQRQKTRPETLQEAITKPIITQPRPEQPRKKEPRQERIIKKPIQDFIKTKPPKPEPRTKKPPTEPPPIRIETKAGKTTLLGIPSARLKQAYNTYVKEKGRFLKVNKKPLPENKAFNRGFDVVDNTPSATFKIVKSKKKTKIQDDFTKRGLAKLRRKKELFIELNRHRIDTQGELQGITVKGYMAAKRKAAQRRVANFLSTKKTKTRSTKWFL